MHKYSYNIFLKYIMLYNIFIKIRTLNFLKNGLYLDYGLKCIVKFITYNLFVYLAYFFAEKYLIEYNTRYLFNYTVALFNTITLQFSNDRIYTYIILFVLNMFIFVY